MRLGIDWGGTKMEIIALSDNGDELYRKRVAILHMCQTLLKHARYVVCRLVPLGTIPRMQLGNQLT